MDGDAELGLLREIHDELRGLRADLARRRQSPPIDREDRELLVAVLPTIAAVVGTRAFTVSELRRHARLAELGSLRAAIERAGGGNRLGRLLKRSPGYDVGELRIEHIGEDRDGLVFVVVNCGAVSRVDRARDSAQVRERAS